MPLRKDFWEQYGSVLANPPARKKLKRTSRASKEETIRRRARIKGEQALDVLRGLMGREVAGLSVGDNLPGLRKITVTQRTPEEERLRLRHRAGNHPAQETPLIRNPLHLPGHGAVTPTKLAAELAYLKQLRDEKG